MLILVALVVSCSSSPHSDGDSAATDADTDADTDCDSDSDTETGSDSDTAPTGWSWMNTPLNVMGEFTQIAGRGVDDFLATGLFASPSEVSPFFVYDGVDVDLDTPLPGTWLSGTGVCVSPSGTYHLATLADGFPGDQPHFFSAQDSAWEEVSLPGGLCAGGDWWPAGAFIESGRHLTCLEPEGFAALLTCAIDPPPQLIEFHLLVHDGQGWETSILLSVSGCAVPSSALWGESADDLFVFITQEETPGYRFDGAVLTPMTPPYGYCTNNGGGGVVAMAASGTSQGADPGYWAIGTNICDAFDPSGYRGFLWRSSDGLTWTEVEVPVTTPIECQEFFLDLWVSDKDEVFVVGYRYCPPQAEGDGDALPLLLRFDGEEWEEIEIPQHPLSAGETRARLERIWGVGGEIFIGAAVKLVPNWYTPGILRYLPE
jgi:hypothetical protein